MKKTMPIPTAIQKILDLLKSHNASAFLVGGCVRDNLLNREIHDYDITTSALPQEMMEWFKTSGYAVLSTGLKHGTISVLVNHEPVEITTYRKESAYFNHRSPASVTFSKDLREDLQRRDFTINAMAYDSILGIIDPFDGQKDIEKKVIRCVGTPTKRFTEDALRILRALRFACTLNFTIEENTWKALQIHASDLSYISQERIRDEFNRILMAQHPHTLKFLKDARVLTRIIPEYAFLYEHIQPTPWHIYDIFQHCDVALDHTFNYPLTSKLAIVFHDIGKPECESFDEKGIVHFKGHALGSMKIAHERLNILHYDRATIQKVETLIQYHDYYLKPDRKILRRYLNKFDNDVTLSLEALDIQIADNHAKNPERGKALIENVERCKSMILEMQEEQDLLSLKDLCLNGYDLMALGYQGKQIKDLLNFLFEKVLDNPQLNNKEDLLNLIKKRTF